MATSVESDGTWIIDGGDQLPQSFDLGEGSAGTTPVDNWDTVVVQVDIYSSTYGLLRLRSDDAGPQVVKQAQPTEDDPTIVTVTLTSGQTAANMRGRYWVRVFDSVEDEVVTHIIGTSGNQGGAPFRIVGNISGTPEDFTVQTYAALDTTLTAHIGDTNDAHDASAISVLDTAGRFAATDVEAALAEVADPLGHVEKLPAWAYGHSWVATNDESTSGAKWVDRVASRARLGTLTNRGASGNSAFDTAGRLIGNQGSVTWTSGTKGLLFLQTGAWELLNTDLTVTANREAFEHQVRAMLLALGASSRIEATAFTTSGTWTVQADTNFSAGSRSHATVNGAYAEFSVSGDAVTVLAGGIDTASFGAKSFDVTIDGGAATNYTTADRMKAAVDNVFGFYPIELSGMGSGSHTVRLTVAAGTGGGTQYGILDCALVPSSTPPQVVVVRDVRFRTDTISEANKTAYDTAITNATAGLSYVTVVDPSTGFDIDTMIGADNTHPNDRGQDHIASAVMTSIRTLDFRNGQNALAT